MSKVKVAPVVFAVRPWALDMPLVYVDLSHIKDMDERIEEAEWWHNTLHAVCNTFSLEDLLYPYQIDTVLGDTLRKPGVYLLKGAKWVEDNNGVPRLTSDIEVVCISEMPKDLEVANE